MAKILNQFQNGTKQILLKFVTKTIPSLLVSLVLMLGGIYLLSLRIPGWSLIFGLPAISTGIIFLIFTFDEIAQNKVGPNSLHVVSCSICGQPTLAPKWQKEKTCEKCQKKKLNLS